MLEDLIKFRDASNVFSILQEKQGESRFVGGCVRNVICGLKVNDVDIATTLRPEEVENLFKSHNIKTLDVGKDHGTIIAIIDSFSYEITTLRKDVETDGRRAVIEYSSDWREDASRRDFTINAMSYCPKENKLYDYFGGLEDLKKGIIKFVGDPAKRVKEDYLRILRFFRFYAYCGKSSNIDQPSLEACREYAHYIKELSPERKLYEFTKILEHEKASNTIIIMGKNSILNNLFESPVNETTYELLLRLDKISQHISVSSNPFLKMFAIINISKISVKETDVIFHLSNEIKKYFTSVIDLVSNGISEVKNNLYKYIYEERRYIMDAVVYLFAQDNVNDYAFLEEVNRLLNNLEEFPVSGEDIIKNLNIEQGTEVGRFLNLGKEFWYKSKYSVNKKQILEYLIDSK